MQKKEIIRISSEADRLAIRQIVRKWSVENKFRSVDQTKLITAVSELSRNVLLHGGGGIATLELISEGFKTGIRATFEDKGPGIEDIELAISDGYSSGAGLGLGLGGAKRLSDEFEISSEPGKGTKVKITKWK